MKKTLIPVVLIVLAAGAWFVLRGAPQTGAPAPAERGGGGRAVPVTVALAQPAPLSETIEAIGTTRANESVTISAKVTDKISAIDFEDGDYVEAGAVLVQLTNDEQTAQLGEAKADLHEARTQLRRLEDLAAKGTVSKAQLDEARARYSVTSARLEGIVARLADRVVRAPFAGVLGFRQISPGTLVGPGTAITTLDDVSTLKLDFSIPELFLTSIARGAQVYAWSPAYRDVPFVGTVTGIDSRINEVTRSVTVRAALPNEEGKLRPGMLLTVELVTEQREALAIPQAAVIPADGGAYVYVVDAQAVAHRRNVETGLTSDGLIEIREGLQPGERVAVLGLIKLRDGARVTIQSGEGVSAAEAAKLPGKT